MKNFELRPLLFLFFISLAVFSQNTLTVGLYNTNTFGLYPKVIPSFLFNTEILPKDYLKGPNTLIIYNTFSQTNETFMRDNNNNQYYLGNITPPVIYSYDGIRMDSFNPYGSLC